LDYVANNLATTGGKEMVKQQILAKAPIFNGLSPEELDSIAKLCESQTYKKNDVIFTEKSHGKELFVVAKGRVRIELEIKGEAEKATVHRVQPGGVFGELALVNEGRRSATARSETTSDIIILDRNDLLSLFKENSHIGYILMTNLASVLATKLRQTDLQLVACFLWE
jgi:CRP/FNR family transcriptional regulator